MRYLLYFESNFTGLELDYLAPLKLLLNALFSGAEMCIAIWAQGIYPCINFVSFFTSLPGEIAALSTKPCMNLSTTIAPLCTAHLTALPPTASIPQGVSIPPGARMSPVPTISHQIPTMWRGSLNTSTAGFHLPGLSRPSKESQCSCVSSSLPAWLQPWCGT